MSTTSQQFKSRTLRIRTRPRAARITVVDQRGQATVEFAVVAVVLLAIVVGILDFGRLFNYDAQVTHLADEAARYAAVNYNPCGASASDIGSCMLTQLPVNAELKKGSKQVTSAAAISFCLPNGTGNPQIGDPVEAKVTFTFKLLPIIGGISVPVTQTATMPMSVLPTSSPAYSYTGPPC